MKVKDVLPAIGLYQKIRAVEIEHIGIHGEKETALFPETDMVFRADIEEKPEILERELWGGLSAREDCIVIKVKP